MEWSDFPAKNLILDYLDYESRCNLRVCSKDDKDLVDSSHFVASKIVLLERPSDMDEEKSILRLDIDSFTIWFIGKHEKTRIERTWNGETMEMSETKQENRVDVLRRFIDKFLKNGIFEAIRLDIMGISIEPSEHWRIKCSVFNLYSPGTPAQWILNWMGKVETKLRELDVQNWSLEGISEIPCVLNVSEKLHLADGADFTDEQLEGVMATNLQMSSPNITLEGVKKAFERYLKNGRLGDRLILLARLPEDYDPVEVFFKNMTIKKIDGLFPEENIFKITGGFNNRHGIPLCTCRCLPTIFQACLEAKQEKPKRHYILWPFTR